MIDSEFYCFFLFSTIFSYKNRKLPTFFLYQNTLKFIFPFKNVIYKINPSISDHAIPNINFSGLQMWNASPESFIHMRFMMNYVVVILIAFLL